MPLLAGALVSLPEAATHHASRVLRLRAGDEVAVFNGEGGEYPARLESVGKNVTARLGEHLVGDRESPLRVTLAQVIPAGERMDWIVQKATELGVARLVPLQSARSVVRLAGERADKRVAHWRGVAIAACEQCGRNRLPEITPIRELRGWLAETAGTGAGQVERQFVLSPDATLRLREVVSAMAETATTEAADAPRLTLLVGPEGGLEAGEEAAAFAAGWEGLSLGPRILRADTAGIAAIAAWQALAGDI